MAEWPFAAVERRELIIPEAVRRTYETKPRCCRASPLSDRWNCAVQQVGGEHFERSMFKKY